MNFEVKTWGQTDIDDNAILFILLFLNLFFFSDKRPEQSIAAARASVMVYDDLNKKWVPAGSSHGRSKVTITNVLMDICPHFYYYPFVSCPIVSN